MLWARLAAVGASHAAALVFIRGQRLDHGLAAGVAAPRWSSTQLPTFNSHAAPKPSSRPITVCKVSSVKRGSSYR
jgi:hypothetical protein